MLIQLCIDFLGVQWQKPLALIKLIILSEKYEPCILATERGFEIFKDLGLSSYSDSFN